MRTFPPLFRSVFALSILMIGFSAQAQDLRVLMVGGGPNPKSNQVAIENNLRYLLRLLPPTTPRTVLFADGDPQAETVLFEEQERRLPDGERLLILMLEGYDAAHPTSLKFRKPSLSQLDGPSKKAAIATAFERLQAEMEANPRPLLLYFTGHGERARDRNLDNNVYDLWDGTLSVRELATHIARLPADRPLTLVMVQCYSGAFANLLFEGGAPEGALIERDFAGFFATVKERPAAGCTPELDEKEYHDFTSYFFAALTGRDRAGRPVQRADYNGDGRVGMDEAFSYTLIHNTSIDVPVCTSDIFLRRFVTTPDEEVFQTPYSQAKAWATPSQRAALEALSSALQLTGEDRARAAYNRFHEGGGERQSGEDQVAAAMRAFARVRQEARRRLLARWPDLADLQSPAYATARREALAFLADRRLDGSDKELLEAERALDVAMEENYRRKLTEARQLRFIRLFKSVVLAQRLRESSEETLKRRFQRLVEAESRPLLPPVSARRAAR